LTRIDDFNLLQNLASLTKIIGLISTRKMVKIAKLLIVHSGWFSSGSQLANGHVGRYQSFILDNDHPFWAIEIFLTEKPGYKKIANLKKNWSNIDLKIREIDHYRRISAFQFICNRWFSKMIFFVFPGQNPTLFGITRNVLLFYMKEKFMHFPGIEPSILK
jgi:hypothetical protein